MNHILTFDIGGTYIKYAVMNTAYEILERGKAETPRESREQLISTLSSIYGKFSDISGIAISMPGIIDTENGYCKMGGSLHYNDDFYLAQALKEKCPVDIVIENDAKCAAMAEASEGSLKDVEDGFVLIFGTMVGGGYIRNHKLVRGKHFSAGEISYILSGNDAPAFEGNIFGNRCSASGLCRMYAEKKQLDVKEVTGRKVFDAVNANDPEAIEVLDRVTREIAVQIFSLQTILDVERFAIGGGISAQPAFTESIRSNLKKLYDECPFTLPQAEITTCMFQNDANLIGALSCFLAACQ